MRMSGYGWLPQGMVTSEEQQHCLSQDRVERQNTRLHSRLTKQTSVLTGLLSDANTQ